MGSEITNPALGPSLQGTGKSGTWFFNTFLPKFITLGFIIGAVVFFFILIVGAIQWITAGGDKTALEGARGKISNAFVGLIILFSIFAVLKLIENFFGITILTLDIGALTIQ